MNADKKTYHNPDELAEAMQELLDTKQAQTQQPPTWPGAREQAEPQHRHAQPVSHASNTPRERENTPPPESGYERSEIGKRHH